MKLCSFGFHKWNLIAINTQFHTNTGNGNKVFWIVQFYQCSKCDKRKSKANTKDHDGIKLAQELWEGNSILYNSTVLVSEMEYAFKYKTNNVVDLKLIRGTKNEGRA